MAHPGRVRWLTPSGSPHAPTVPKWIILSEMALTSFPRWLFVAWASPRSAFRPAAPVRHEPKPHSPLPGPHTEARTLTWTGTQAKEGPVMNTFRPSQGIVYDLLRMGEEPAPSEATGEGSLSMRSRAHRIVSSGQPSWSVPCGARNDPAV